MFDPISSHQHASKEQKMYKARVVLRVETCSHFTERIIFLQ